jgi:hypothetical protein
MMKLFDRLPEGIQVGKRFFKCDFDFRNVLRLLETMQREDLVPDARDYLCIKCVISHKIPSKIVSEVYKVLCDTLFEKTPETGENSGKKLTSFEQDAPLIRAAFRQVYNIDLFRDKLTWFEFTELLQGLPEGNRYEEIIGIRARPIPAPTKYNQKEREWLMKAKQSCALHLTEQEQAKKYDADAGKVFAGLMSMIKKEVNTGGK